MKLAIMQPYYFPYIGYFQLIDAADKFMIYEHVSFRKKSWITRNRILDKGLKCPLKVSIPIKNQSSFNTIKKVQIDNSLDWRKKHIDLIYYNYKKALYFEEIFPLIEYFINIERADIHSYNSLIVIEICKILDIKTPIVYENKYCKDIEKYLIGYNVATDFRKYERIFEICKAEKASEYLNPIGGEQIYSKEVFEENRLKLGFIETHPYSYNQFDNEFEPHLSIIDFLMHNGIEETKKSLKNYSIKYGSKKLARSC